MVFMATLPQPHSHPPNALLGFNEFLQLTLKHKAVLEREEGRMKKGSLTLLCSISKIVNHGKCQNRSCRIEDCCHRLRLGAHHRQHPVQRWNIQALLKLRDYTKCVCVCECERGNRDFHEPLSLCMTHPMNAAKSFLATFLQSLIIFCIVSQYLYWDTNHISYWVWHFPFISSQMFPPNCWF